MHVWPELRYLQTSAPCTAFFEIGVVEDDERRVPPELERDLLQGSRALRHQQLPHLGRPCEAKLADERLDVISPPITGASSASPVTTEKTPGGTPPPPRAPPPPARRSGVCSAGFSTIVHPTASVQGQICGSASRTEVPGRDPGRDADRLLGDDDALLGPRRRHDAALETLRLLPEPLVEGRGARSRPSPAAACPAPSRAARPARRCAPASGLRAAAARMPVPLRPVLPAGHASRAA